MDLLGRPVVTTPGRQCVQGQRWWFFRFPSDFLPPRDGRQRGAVEDPVTQLQMKPRARDVMWFHTHLAMTAPNPQELRDTAQELSTYRDRLKADVIAMGQKLRLPQKQIEASLEKHAELQRIEGVLSLLQDQINSL